MAGPRMRITSLLFRLIPALLAALLLAAAPSVAAPCSAVDVTVAAVDKPVSALGHISKSSDQFSKRLRDSDSLEEFFAIDDDAEQYLKLRHVLAHASTVAFVVRAGASCFDPARRSHRACAAFATGPPSV
jgi:hypothetical protein